jgi:hypothetical protein
MTLKPQYNGQQDLTLEDLHSNKSQPNKLRRLHII